MARVIGKVKKTSSSKGVDYRFSINVTNAEFAANYKYHGSDISSLQSDFSSDTIYCMSVTCRSNGYGGWVITYWGVDSIDDYNFSMVSSKINKSYSSSEFQFTPHMLGVRVATAADVTAGIKNINDSGICSEGDFIYVNATDASGGSANGTGSPVVLPASLNQDNVNFLLSFRLPTQIYTVRFPDSRADSDDFEAWRGINGTFPTKLAPATTTAGYWRVSKAWNETVKSGLSTTQYVARSCESCPIYLGVALLWDSDKFSTWTW